MEPVSENTTTPEAFFLELRRVLAESGRPSAIDLTFDHTYRLCGLGSDCRLLDLLGRAGSPLDPAQILQLDLFLEYARHQSCYTALPLSVFVSILSVTSPYRHAHSTQTQYRELRRALLSRAIFELGSPSKADALLSGLN